MSVAPIKAFSEKAKADAAVGEALKACQKIKELRALAQENGFTIEENSFAGFTLQSNPPASVPNAIFTPAFIARLNVSS